MPKLIDLRILEQVAFKQAPPKPDLPPRPLSDSFEHIDKPTRPILKDPNYFLFMLGTDTVYTHLPTCNSPDPKIKKTYENGETLSYMARVIAHTLGETKPEISMDQALSFSTASVDVVNGPSTMGAEIGERIALGVFLILRALSEGKSTVQIAAHSRGAVESILIAHELERIKKELQKNPKQSIYQILNASPCVYTKAAFKKPPFKEAGESEEVRKALATSLSSAKINLFLIDPVPGGSYRGLSFLAWRDERFYIKPPCSEAELLLLRDERTRCFIPVAPAGMVPLIIPGHHGTASGNIYSQQSEAVPERIKERDTSSVQHLVVIKLLNFINKNTGLFNSRVQPVELGHLDLDVTTNQFINQGKKNRLAQLLEHYQRVRQNDEAFKHFTKTSYAVLGSEVEVSSKSRMVHFGSHNYMGMAAFAPGLEGPFVNSEHVLLYLHEQISFSLEIQPDAPDKLVQQFTVILNNLFSEYAKPINNKIHSILDHDESRLVMYQALSTFVDTISQTYLRNHLTIEAKKALIDQITSTFTILEGFKNNRNKERLNGFIDEFKNILHKNIRRTVETHYKSLLDRTKKLETEVDYFLRTDQEVMIIFNDFLSAIGNKSQEYLKNKAELSQIFSSMRDELIKASPKTIDQIRAECKKQIEKMGNHKLGNEAIAILATLADASKHGIQQHLLADLPNDAEFFVELDRIYENFSSLVIGKDQIKTLVGNESLNLNIKEVEQQKDLLIRLAAMIFIKKKLDISKQPINISKEFFVQVQLKILAMTGVKSGLVVMTEKDALEKEARAVQLAKLNALLREEILTLRAQVDKYKTELLAAKKINDELAETKLLLTAALQNSELLKQQITKGNLEHAQRVKQLELTIDTAKSQSEQAVRIANDALQLEKNQHAQQLEELRSQLKSVNAKAQQLTTELSDKNEKLLAKQNEVTELAIQLPALMSDHSNLQVELQKAEDANKAEKQRLQELLAQEKIKSSGFIAQVNQNLLQLHEMEQGRKALKHSVEELTQQLQEARAVPQKDNSVADTTIANLRQQLAASADKDTAQRELILTRDAEIAQLKAQQEKQAELVEQLLSPREITSARFITDKLIPSTQDYLHYLMEKAQKINPSFSQNEKNVSSFSGNTEEKGAYDKIITKYMATKQLLSDLSDQTTSPLPSTRILKFTTSLNNTNKQLKEHRDPDWISFFKATMVAIGVVCSGIIPGIIALLAYSSYEGKSPLFFAQSKGEQFVNKMTDFLSNTESEFLAI